MPELLAPDLDMVLNRTRFLWKELRGGRIFITGGSGFSGRWMLESFVRANQAFQLNAQAVALTRDPLAFARQAPHLAGHPAIRLLEGDVRNFTYPAGRFTHVIHAAMVRDPHLYVKHPLRMLDVTLSSTRHILDFALQCGNPKFLLVSSSAVYGRVAGLIHVDEEYPGEPDVRDPDSAYGEGSRLSETLCLTYGRHYGLQVKIGRCFAMLGPYLSLESSGIAGRFIQEGLQGGPIRVNGNGSAAISYLYAVDMAVWLWTLLINGECGRPYNIGSEQAIPIADLAQQVGRAFTPPIAVSVIDPAGDSLQAGDCLPSTRAARERLHLTQDFSLQESILRTVAWVRRVCTAPGSDAFSVQERPRSHD